MPEPLAVVLDSLPYLLQGTFLTAGIVGAAMLLGLISGIFMAVGLVYGNRAVQAILTFYLWIFRGCRWSSCCFSSILTFSLF